LRNKIRQERIERAFAATRIRRLEKLDLRTAFTLSAGGILLAGFGMRAAITIGAAMTLLINRRRIAASFAERPAAVIVAVRAERTADLQKTKTTSQALNKHPIRKPRRGLER